MLFTLDDVVESMEQRASMWGIAFVLKALNHATGTLRDVIVTSERVLLGPAFCPYLPLYSFYILTIVFL